MRALISVSDKTGIVDLAKGLKTKGCEILSTGGTAKILRDNGIDVKEVSDMTGFPECLDGRVKTLHPAVHGGILARRDIREHMEQLGNLNIETIDIVVINLYPFKETILKEGVELEEAIENIDIGGPAMLRSAAKNHKDVIVISDPCDYKNVLKNMDDDGNISYDERYRLALKVFQHTAAYDSLIASYLREKISGELPDEISLTYEKCGDLRYGENPHQKAWYYKEAVAPPGSIVNAKQIHGKELSFNNINDTNGALALLKEFDEPTVVAVKHGNPCGVCSADNVHDAYIGAYSADPVSIFGGIVAINREVDAKTATEINKIFLEIIIAPGFSKEALDILTLKKNIRLLELKDITAGKEEKSFDIKRVSGGILIQESDNTLYNESKLSVVTKNAPDKEQTDDMEFAMKVVKHIHSNGIAVVKEKKTLGVGAGQVNRIWAVENAISRSLENVEGAVLASDAFFPFDDCVTTAASAGIKAIIQPGGSMRDEDSIKKADELGIAMVFTGERHFKH